MTPSQGNSASSDITDVVLQQAQMVAFCIPVVGPAFAALASIFGAVYDATKPSIPDRYSIAQAIADLGARISQLPVTLVDQLTKDTVGGWQTFQWQCEQDIGKYLDTGSATTFQNTVDGFSLLAADTIFAGLGDSGATPVIPTWDPLAPKPTASGGFPMAPLVGTFSDQDVERLDLYVKARTAYHSLLISLLRTQALVADPPIPPTCWTALDVPLRDRLQESLAWGISHIDRIAGAIDYVETNGIAIATAAAGDNTDRAAWNVRYTTALRNLRTSVSANQTTPKRVANYLSIRDAYQDTLNALTAPSSVPTPNTNTTGSAPKSGGLGKLLPNTARFLFETSVVGGPINVVANPLVAPGRTATQDAGSVDPACYFQLGGTGSNADFLKQITDSGADIKALQTALQTAYDTHLNSPGQWAKDSASPPTTPVYTTLAVSLSSGGPVGDRVVALLYTTAPAVAVGGLTNASTKQQLTQIYTDVFAAITAWNKLPPTIVNLRLTMLSLAPDPTSTAEVAHNKAIAEVIVDATVAALKADPTLVGVIVLISTDDANGGPERAAFSAVASDRKVRVNLEGFDISLT